MGSGAWIKQGRPNQFGLFVPNYRKFWIGGTTVAGSRSNGWRPLVICNAGNALLLLLGGTAS
jgi:hypothetical protein